MDEPRWNRAQALFETALALSSAERSAYLDRACESDEELLAEVTRLLQADAGGGTTWGLRSGTRDEESKGPLKAEQQLGPYRIIQEIGFGGMGVVYEAVDTRLDRHVAIKCLPPHLSRQSQARQRFISEAKAASTAISSPAT